MPKPISITPTALEDLQTAIDYYNEQLPDLGSKFEATINKHFVQIGKMPKAASFIYGRVRYKSVDRYPFIITYEELKASVAILRIFNTYQHPDKM